MDNIDVSGLISPPEDRVNLVDYVRDVSSLTRDYASLLNLKLSAGLVDSQIYPKAIMLVAKYHNLFEANEEIDALLSTTSGTGTINLTTGVAVSVGSKSYKVVFMGRVVNSVWNSGSYIWYDRDYISETDPVDIYSEVGLTSPTASGAYIILYNITDDEYTSHLVTNSSPLMYQLNDALAHTLNQNLAVSGQTMDISTSFPYIANLRTLVSEIKDSLESVSST
jgi:hypothetical protein